MEFPAPYHTTPEERWAKLEKDSKRNPKKIPKPIKAMRIKGDLVTKKTSGDSRQRRIACRKVVALDLRAR
ncbi:MAG: hypothetical protein ACOYM3_28240 [Terrimicrobiaceae bacterium]